jgi:dienelactone hydrolase
MKTLPVLFPATLLWTLALPSTPSWGQTDALGDVLPRTERLTLEGDIASQLVEGVDRFLLSETEKSVERRARRWKRDFSSGESYQQSVEPNRRRLAAIIGAVDERVPCDDFDFSGGMRDWGPRAQLVAGEEPRVLVFPVRWPVVRGVHGEGLLLLPCDPSPRSGTLVDALVRRADLAGDVIVIPDAGQTPEMLAGLARGLTPEQQFALRLAERGCRVLVPALIDRGTTLSATVAGQHRTKLSHREFLYRPAFELGRHIIGYEVLRVLAAVDIFRRQSSGEKRRLVVVGYGEGGLIGFYSAALDTRIDAASISGYFGSRQRLWEEPIDRNVFGLLDEFGDAEIASLIAPRTLIVEAAKAPEVVVPPGTGGAPGKLTTPALETVRAEIERARGLVSGLVPSPRLEVVASADGHGPFFSRPFFDETLGSLAVDPKLARERALVSSRTDPDPERRLGRLFRQIEDDTQKLLVESPYVRQEFWKQADRASRSVEKWVESTREYRRRFYDEVIGRFDLEKLPANPRSRRIYDEPAFTGWEVVLDVFPDVFAHGILLLPKGIRDGERRPAVVCQHGLEGRPTDVADPKLDHPAYHRYAVRLAERGFVTFAPQNLYIFGDRFRSLQRKANPLGKTLFSIIVPQHECITEWLASLPWVDPERIGFYGLSYGGKTAMRVPPLVDRYCLSICSADFNEWIWKNASTRSPYSYVSTGEYEIFEFNLGMTFNYAEMAGLIAPRPFMVERGHRDGVAPDETVSYEFAKVRLLYADLRIPERAEIEYFDGPHTIHGVGTFDFLHRHLRWPKPGEAPPAK